MTRFPGSSARGLRQTAQFWDGRVTRATRGHCTTVVPRLQLCARPGLGGLPRPVTAHACVPLASKAPVPSPPHRASRPPVTAALSIQQLRPLSSDASQMGLEAQTLGWGGLLLGTTRSTPDSSGIHLTSILGLRGGKGRIPATEPGWVEGSRMAAVFCRMRVRACGVCALVCARGYVRMQMCACVCVYVHAGCTGVYDECGVCMYVCGVYIGMWGVCRCV